MKKTLAMILAAVMVLLTVPAGAETTAGSLTGIWYAVEISAEGITMNPADMGLNITMTVNEDGTLVIGQDEEDSTAGTWTATENGMTVAYEDQSGEVRVEDGKLLMDADGAVYTFAREAAEGFTAPARAAAASEEAFLGTYQLTYLEMMGQFLPVKALGMDSRLTVEAGKIILETISPKMDEDGNLTDEMETETVEYATSFEDGLLKYTDETDVKSYSALKEDGTVVMSQEEDPEADFSLTVNMFFSRAE